MRYFKRCEQKIRYCRRAVFVAVKGKVMLVSAQTDETTAQAFDWVLQVVTIRGQVLDHFSDIQLAESEAPVWAHRSIGRHVCMQAVINQAAILALKIPVYMSPYVIRLRLHIMCYLTHDAKYVTDK